MDIEPSLENRIIECGKRIFSSISNEKPSIFNKSAWMGKVLDWSMQNEGFKTSLFRFVDVFPSLSTSGSLTRHIKEYFGEDDNVPSVLKWGARSAGIGGLIGGKILNTLISRNIKTMASQFIIGEDTKSAIKNIKKLRKEGFTAILDLLGEAVISEQESKEHFQIYLELLEGLSKDQSSWLGVNSKTSLKDWDYSPFTQISVKISALYSQIKPQDFENSVQRILERLEVIYEKVVGLEGSMCIDMESYKYKAITIEVFKRLRASPKFREYPYLGIVLQAYLRDTDNDLDELISWAKENELPIEIRLVKGAYWDYETITAKQHGLKSNVWPQKPETDAAFERHSKKILENSDMVYFACASHNIRSIAYVIEMAKELEVPENRYEFQVLYGMAEPVRNTLRNLTGRIRLYAPYGKMVPGMAYLVRRLLENTANESFLRQSFVEDAQVERLLENPLKTLAKSAQTASLYDVTPEFCNEPELDYTILDEVERFKKATKQVRSQLGKHYSLHINGEDIQTDNIIESKNPNQPDEILGLVSAASTVEISSAISAAKAAFPAWSSMSPEKRALFLKRAAQAARSRIYELSAWQTLEVGKQWDQAYADVNEAIDFLEYYAGEMIRLGRPTRLNNLPGEINLLSYHSRGVAAVIAPWNFPLAISVGMVAAAIVTGNTVVYKPSERSSIIGHHLVQLLSEAQLPPGVFNYIPALPSDIGDYLIDHPDISTIAFTGSMKVGLHINQRAGITQSGQAHVKKVICEMGGKNAIILDDDTDLDEAIPAVLYSAFAFQGQKCSACSRLIILEDIYDRAINRLVNAAKSLKIGTPEDPANLMGAVIDEKALEGILSYQEIAQKEGNLLFKSGVSDTGYVAPMMIVDGILPSHTIAQEEVFGPILAVMKAKDFSHALELANSTRFGLTGSVFSRSPKNLERARQELNAGNLYLNRGSTGAVVSRQAFGGAYMSGTGTKAGGPDYLQHFMISRVTTENTMRRGFAPMDE